MTFNKPTIERCFARYMFATFPELIDVAQEMAEIRYAKREEGAPVPQIPAKYARIILDTINHARIQ